MTQPWWGKESRPHRRAPLRRGRGASLTPEPELAPASRRAVFAEVLARIPAYTPEWTNQRQGDAGVALAQLFAELSEPVITRLDLLPRKALVEFLRLAGSSPQWATPASALLEFTVSEGAPQSVQIPQGFQVGARPATGEGEMVIFETEFGLYAAPSKVEKIYTQEGDFFSEVDPKGEEPFRAFGQKPVAGRALLVGLAGAAAPTSFLSVGVAVAAGREGTPPPVPSGGVEPRALPSQPLLRWEVLDGASYLPAEVVRDETGGLARSGIVELRLPRSWRTGAPAGLEEEADAGLRWLRVRIAFGQYQQSPLLSFVRLNMARATAARTIRDEVLEPVAGSSGGTQMRLSQTPVIPGTLVLEVDEGGLGSDFDLGGERTGAGGAEPPGAFGRRWKQVESLTDADADDEVYTLDAATGVVTFGDGVHGAAVPKGFRNVRAASYRVGGGAAGAVEADEIKTLLSSAPFVTGVTNPLRASGGADPETQESAIRRGPQEFRARGRAVTVADYELMALGTPGAQVRRSHAVSGLHPSFPGRPVPGVVGVFVVPPDSGEGPPPVPDEASLRAVAEYLAAELAPTGVEVVAAAPRYHRIRALAGLVIDPTADASELVRRVLEELDTYLHPLKGGEGGEGWPFGGVLQYAALLRRLLANVPHLLAIPRLNFVIDGARVPGCADFTPAAHALFWPSGHEIVVLESEGGL